MNGRALVAYSAMSTHVQTTLDYLMGFANHSSFQTSFIHSTNGARIDVDLDQYDVVFNNYCSRLCFEGYVSEQYQEKLKKFKGVKILAVQDEYDNTDILKAAIRRLGFDIVLTCIPQDSVSKVYPVEDFPNVRFVTVFTGYVPDDFAAKATSAVALRDRPVTVGYRGRDIGGRYGRLGFDKFEIGRRMKEICDARGVVNDIAMDEASRIYGAAWFDFLGRCRSMLGSESGSNVFDFDGSVARRFKAMTDANGGRPPSYQDFLPVVAERESLVDMGQISPRVFECAVMRTPMVLFRGRYSDAIRPDEHYIALEKDFSNVDDVFRRLEDFPALEAMTERAYDHLVGSGQFSYQAFFRKVGDLVRRHPKFVGRAFDYADRVASGAPTFFVRDMMAVERASATPDDMPGYMARAGLDEIRLLLSEDRRLTDLFDHSRRSIMRAAASQLDNCRGIFVKIAEAGGPIVDRTADIDRELADDRLSRFLAAADAEDHIWRERWSAAEARIAGLDVGETAHGQNTAINEALDIARNRYKSLAERFQQMNAAYETRCAQIQALSAGAVRTALRTAYRAGALSRPLVEFALVTWIRAALARIVYGAYRVFRRAAGAVARPVLSRPHLRDKAYLTVRKYPLLLQCGRRLKSWLQVNRL